MSNDSLNADFIGSLLRHEPTVRAFLRPMLFGADEVDEVMQRASTVAWQKYADSLPIQSFPTWLCVIARYEALRFARDAARRPVCFDHALVQLLADEGLDEIDEREMELRALEDCLQKLPPQTRVAVMAVHRSGESIKKVAASLGSSAEAIYKRVQRARNQLLQCVQQRLAAGEAS